MVTHILKNIQVTDMKRAAYVSAGCSVNPPLTGAATLTPQDAKELCKQQNHQAEKGPAPRGGFGSRTFMEN